VGPPLARLIGAKWGVKMSSNRALNEGMHGRTPIVIKCAKSTGAPIQVSKATLERVGEVWGVFLSETDSAPVWRLSASEFKRVASFYSPRNGTAHYQIRYKRFTRVAELIGTVAPEEVEVVEIP
jgi:hypothetical protein